MRRTPPVPRSRASLSPNRPLGSAAPLRAGTLLALALALVLAPRDVASVSLASEGAAGTSGEAALAADSGARIRSSTRTRTRTRARTHVRARAAGALVPLTGVDPPVVASKTSRSVTLRWNDAPGKDHLVWNLLMNRVSVYSGVEHSYEQTGLAPAACYSFQLAYYWGGQWSQFSKPLNVSTTAAAGDTDPFAVDAELSQLRRIIERRATATVAEESVCELAQVANPQYVAGSLGAAEYIGTLGPLARAGVQASARNCLVSQCAPASAATQAIDVGRAGYLRLRAADGVFEQVYAQVPPAANFVEFSGAGTFREHAVNLLGCRAHNMTARTAGALAMLPGRTSPDPRASAGLRRSCLEVNCSATLTPLVLCEPTDTTAGARDLQAWKHVLNRASQARHTIQKYEVVVKVVPARAVDAAGPGRQLQLYVQPAYREAWMATHLMRLALSHTSPHFPALLDFFRCSTVPQALIGSPQSDAAGALPPFVDGAAGLAAEQQIGLEEGLGSHFFAGLLLETFSTTMQTVVDSYKDFALSRAFVQGVVFQLLHALGVARRVFGFHHNDLLTLSNIRFRQIPAESVAARRHWCYVLNDEAFSEVEDYREADLTTVSEMTFGELLQPDACAPGGGASNATTSFCVNADEVDGLRLLLYGFATSTAVKPELSRWKAGWAFQNTPWDDDTRSVGVIACDMLGVRVAGFRDESARGVVEDDFCAALRNGTFAANALSALRHPYFADLPALNTHVTHGGGGGGGGGGTDSRAAVRSADAEIFTYLPRPTAAGGHGSVAATTTAAAAAAPDSGANAPETGGVAMKFRQQRASASASAFRPPGNPSLAQPSRAASTSNAVAAAAAAAALDVNAGEPTTPWIVSKSNDAVSIAWTRQAGTAAAPGVSMVFLNGVSVYTGPATTWTQRGLTALTCYRFQVAALGADSAGWGNASAPLFVNDCSHWKQKMCREHPDCWLGQRLSTTR